MSHAVGVTGTRQGPTPEQFSGLSRILRWMMGARGISELHHGDCIGVDTAAHNVAATLGLRIVVHPPDNDRLRVYALGDEVRDTLPYLRRNHRIVDETAALIALPLQVEEQRRSGTWATVRYARKQGGPIYLIRPNGLVVINGRWER